MIFEVNGRRLELDVNPEMPLLWVLRENLGLTGTKFGCGLGQCGACTVHIDGNAVRSCTTLASAATGKKITTIEGLSPTSSHAAADGVGGRAGAAVRLLPVGPADVGGGAAGEDAAARPTRKSTPPCPATSAAAAPISGSGAPFIARREVGRWQALLVQPSRVPEDRCRRRRWSGHRRVPAGIRSERLRGTARRRSSRTSGSASTPTTPCASCCRCSSWGRA